ncbi:DUF255 domain-containing protein [Sulfurimonas sp. C5]|uniref:thioredoxin family protein n=1 Tax=Sulfurimonas sp. C5 TaxID=3036947 RepID=UPI0024553FA9|nr:DUF255 domain-containing protein [Sulfurimonas sp. C5]MDH4944463.1 DUF255 domain-containing protein [Sulfurimonas sp. C5]
MGTIIRILFCFTIVTASLEAFQWLSYSDALEVQKKTNKPIMLDVMRDTCHYCLKMEKNVFQDPEMARWLEERFIPAQINLDNEKLPLDEQIMLTPTFFFLDENGKILKKIPGSWNIQDFKDLTKGIK